MSMLMWAFAAAAALGGTASDTVIVLGSRTVDMTGDGQAEELQVVGVGQSPDSLAVTFSITSGGRTLFSERLRPMTRTIGFDAGKRTLSPAEHRKRMDEFADFFFDPEKFRSPTDFLKMLEESARLHIQRIPEVIAGQRRGADSRTAAEIWNEMRNRDLTIFQYSAGGDGLTAIAWSPSDQRFYRLWECC